MLNHFLEENESTPLASGTMLSELIKRPELNYEGLAALDPARPELPQDVREQVNIEIKYEGYIRRQFEATKKLKEQEKIKIPPDFDYASVPGLSNELQAKLTRITPATIGQMGRIPGMTEGAVSAVLIMIKKKELLQSTR